MTKFLKYFGEYVQIFLGIVLASIGLKAFLLPNGFLDGGVTGIALLLTSLTGISVSIWLLIVSAPFILLSFWMVSIRIVLKSLVAIATLAMFIYFENFEVVTDDKLLISIFGGLFLGMGIGISIKNGAVLDGSEILGIFVNDRFGIKIGTTILVFNMVLFSITALLISIEVAMYSILTYIITAKVIDFMIEGFEDYSGLMIVSEKFLEIEEALKTKGGMGLTIYKGARGHGKRGSQTEHDIIHLVINRIEIRKTYNIIDAIDSHAFVIEFDVNNVRGGIQRSYMSKIGLENFKALTKNDGEA